MNLSEIKFLYEGAIEGEKYPIARLISQIEKNNSINFRKELFSFLQSYSSDSKCLTIGITGTPGAGKSSLIGQMCFDFLERVGGKRLAIVAIDPSSARSGGAILGDRTRINLPVRENRIFFRSQASQLDVGGMNPYTYHVIRFLRYIFDYVIIETVGIGQNEIEVTNLADFSFLVLQPLGGDQVQFMKSGIMEVPDAFIINKCDEKSLAQSSYHLLSTSLDFLKEIIPEKGLPPIFLTSVLNKIGTTDLLNYILSIQTKKSKKLELELQLKKWIRSEYGNYGWRLFQTQFNVSNPHSLLFEDWEQEFNQFML